MTWIKNATINATINAHCWRAKIIIVKKYIRINGRLDGMISGKGSSPPPHPTPLENGS